MTAAVDALKAKNNALLLCSSVAAFDITVLAALGTEKTAITMQEDAMEEQKKTESALNDALDSSRTETHDANFKLDDANAELQAVHTEGMALLGQMESALAFKNQDDDTTQMEATETVVEEARSEFKTLIKRFDAARLKTSAAMAETKAASAVWELLLEGLRV